jgi:hypothetical protein
MEVLVLDECGEPVKNDEVGEITIRSSYMSPGYWSSSSPAHSIPLGVAGRDGRTNFRTGDLGRLRSNGCLEYLGRKDFRLKIRGHRIQAEEVEAALLNITGITQAAVLARKDIHGDERLVAYLTNASSVGLTVSEIRAALGRCIPDYMIPSKFVFLDRLPLTESGKVNRQELITPRADRPNLATAFDPPVTALERVLTKIWSEALSIAGIGVHDRFLDLGGDSIIAARIVSEMARIFPWKITLKEFYESETVAEISRVLAKEAFGGERAERVAELCLQVDRMSPSEVEAMLTEVRSKSVLNKVNREDDHFEPEA